MNKETTDTETVNVVKNNMTGVTCGAVTVSRSEAPEFTPGF